MNTTSTYITGTSIIHLPRGAALRNPDVLYIAMNNISHVAQPSGCRAAQNCPSSPEAKCHIPTQPYIWPCFPNIVRVIIITICSELRRRSLARRRTPIQKAIERKHGGGGPRWRLYRIMLERCRAQPARSQPHSETDHISPHDSHEGWPLNRWE